MCASLSVVLAVSAGRAWGVATPVSGEDTWSLDLHNEYFLNERNRESLQTWVTGGLDPRGTHAEHVQCCAT